MKLSARKAAAETGLAVTTITRAIDSGQLSAARNEKGGYEIDPAELFRAFPAKRSETPHKLQNATRQETGNNSELPALLKVLEQQISDLRADREAWKAQAEKWEATAGKWQEQAAQALRLLPAPPVTPAPETPAAGQGKPVGGFWARLLGKGAANE